MHLGIYIAYKTKFMKIYFTCSNVFRFPSSESKAFALRVRDPDKNIKVIKIIIHYTTELFLR